MKNSIILVACGLFFGCAASQSTISVAGTLSPKQLADLRIAAVKVVEDSSAGVNPNWNKPKINAIFQAIENWWSDPVISTTQSGRLQLNAVMNSEASNQGFSLTIKQKKFIFAVWMRHKIKQEIGR